MCTIWSRGATHFPYSFSWCRVRYKISTRSIQAPHLIFKPQGLASDKLFAAMPAKIRNNRFIRFFSKVYKVADFFESISAHGRANHRVMHVGFSGPIIIAIRYNVVSRNMHYTNENLEIIEIYIWVGLLKDRWIIITLHNPQSTKLLTIVRQRSA